MLELGEATVKQLGCFSRNDPCTREGTEERKKMWEGNIMNVIEKWIKNTIVIKDERNKGG